MTTIQLNNLIQKWNEADKEAKAARDRELELRNAVLREAFDLQENDEREGTKNIELGKGYKLKATFKQSRRLAGAEEVQAAANKIAAAREDGKFIADRLIKWKADLSISEYKKLPEDVLAIINEVVTTKPASPSLQLVEPKTK